MSDTYCFIIWCLIYVYGCQDLFKNLLWHYVLSYVDLNYFSANCRIYFSLLYNYYIDILLVYLPIELISQYNVQRSCLVKKNILSLIPEESLYGIKVITLLNFIKVYIVISDWSYIIDIILNSFNISTQGYNNIYYDYNLKKNRTRGQLGTLLGQRDERQKCKNHHKTVKKFII